MTTSDPQLMGALLGAEVAFGFATFLPPAVDVRRRAGEPTMRADVRTGEAIACAFALAVAGGIGLVAGTPLPLAFALPACLAMVAIYEGCLAFPAEGAAA
jgi:hypothetical protein